MLTVAYLPEARDDITEAFDWYETKLRSLGDRFLERLRECVARIEIYPTLPAIIDAGIRAVPLKKFPYVVYYRIENDQILIIAVVHGRRSANVWQARS